MTLAIIPEIESVSVTSPTHRAMLAYASWARVIPISADRKHGTFPRWEQRATSDPQLINAWMNNGHANGNVACVLSDVLCCPDVDTPEQRQWFLDVCGGELPDTRVDQTPHGGLHPFFWRPPESAGVYEVGPGIQVRGSGHYVVMPPSSYVHGARCNDNCKEEPGSQGFYVCINNAPQLMELPPELQRPRKVIPVAKLKSAPPTPPLSPYRPTRALSENMQQLLVNGEGDRSDNIFSLAIHAQARGWTWEQLFDALMANPSGPGSKLLERSELSAREYMVATWERAARYLGDNPPVPSATALSPEEIKDIEQAIEDYPWKDTAGSTHYSNINGHLRRAKRYGNHYQYSCLDGFRETGKTKSTISRSNRVLIELGWLICHTEEHDKNESNAYCFSIRIPPSIQLSKSPTEIPPPHHPPPDVSSVALDADSPRVKHPPALLQALWYPQGIHPRRIQILRALDAPMKTAQLATALSLAQRTVSGHLKQLMEMGLVTKQGWFYSRAKTITDKELDALLSYASVKHEEVTKKIIAERWLFHKRHNNNLKEGGE